ncbi:Hypothetical predicted protein [Octopus vulgaris]|uniref:Uncharacterized protein n=1 Tax=Octopus vulgaris TaxID=6645 RepID=A0AA36BIC4_OCTVU|nr:Hypothetical predicted protein [Octopus vulgaris]
MKAANSSILGFLIVLIALTMLSQASPRGMTRRSILLALDAHKNEISTAYVITNQNTLTIIGISLEEKITIAIHFIKLDFSKMIFGTVQKGVNFME